MYYHEIEYIIIKKPQFDFVDALTPSVVKPVFATSLQEEIL